ncbi:MAG TPA: SWIM zinc finger family protein [Candidatus Limnocylindrales bacterium]
MSVATYAYAGESALTADGLCLQTSGGTGQFPRFFTGFMTTPQPVAAGLLAVAEVARTRYFQPTDRRSLDPVVTGSREMLRFESFSGCCGVYARMDVLPAGLDGRTPEHGTTNVDVNAPLQLALARVRGMDPLHLSVGPEALEVSTLDGVMVERKVPLPTRWLRGFAEVQVIAAGMQPRARVEAAQAATVLRGLPNDRSVLWVVPSGRGLRLTSRPVPGAVCLPGPGRLVALRGMLRHAATLTLYGPPVRPGSGPLTGVWVLESATTRLTLMLSPQANRGFSGEGAVLSGLTGDQVADDADLVSAMLAWDPAIDIGALSAACDLPQDRVTNALTMLGTAGRVGFDLSEGSYFHRVMPFGTDAQARLNPRLAAARVLVRDGAVSVTDQAAEVRSGESKYSVRLGDGGPLGCTCLWWGRYRGERGPCKHQLAVAIAIGALVEAA